MEENGHVGLEILLQANSIYSEKRYVHVYIMQWNMKRIFIEGEINLWHISRTKAFSLPFL